MASQRLITSYVPGRAIETGGGNSAVDFIEEAVSLPGEVTLSPPDPRKPEITPLPESPPTAESQDRDAVDATRSGGGQRAEGTSTPEQTSAGFETTRAKGLTAAIPASTPTSERAAEGLVGELIDPGGEVLLAGLSPVQRTGQRSKQTEPKMEVETSASKNPVSAEKEQPEKEEDYDTDLETEEDVKSFHGLTCEELYLEACRLVGVVPVSYFLRNMREATMNLSHHGLGSKGTRAIAIALVSNAFITNLNLDDNRVLAEGVADVVEMLKENCFIQELNLSNNHLEQAGAATISRLLVDNVTLRSLKLSGNMLNHASVKNLAEALAVNGKLEDLDLSHNEFCEKAGEQLGQML
ncbi:leucine-rich repeat-containing protein 74A-like, partial [Rhinatrema bivittatum]|uniref:leucine-rich repeat-containing protein 74A-like n=1 Tax=Rhinatrema bivittatum TaxID=194408 RepID=UPI00112C810C